MSRCLFGFDVTCHVTPRARARVTWLRSCRRAATWPERARATPKSTEATFLNVAASGFPAAAIRVRASEGGASRESRSAVRRVRYARVCMSACARARPGEANRGKVRRLSSRALAVVRCVWRCRIRLEEHVRRALKRASLASRTRTSSSTALSPGVRVCWFVPWYGFFRSLSSTLRIVHSLEEGKENNIATCIPMATKWTVAGCCASTWRICRSKGVYA